MRAAGSRFNKSTPGFSLVELLIGVALSAIAIEAVAQLAVKQVNLANRVYGFTSTYRNFRNLSDLLSIEVSEACILSKGGTPFRSTTWPDTPCKPQVSFGCQARSAANDLYLLIPLQSNISTISYSPIKYYLSSKNLRRNGPPVVSDGSLSTNSIATDRSVLTNVTRFIPTVSADCTSVDLEVGVTYPGKAEARRTFSFYVGSSETIN